MIANHNIKHVSRVTHVSIRTVRPNSKHITHTEESHVINVCGPKIKTTLAYTTILIVLHEYVCPVTFQWVIKYFSWDTGAPVIYSSFKGPTSALPA
jgi:hypothetical protein